MELDTRLPLQAQVQPLPFSARGIQQLREGRMQNSMLRLQEQEAQRQNQFTEATRSAYQRNMKLTPEGQTTLDEGAFVGDLAGQGFGQEAYAISQEIQAKRAKDAEGKLNRVRMENKRRGEIGKELLPMLRAYQDDEEMTKIYRKALDAENVLPENFPETVTLEQLEAYISKDAADPSFAPITSGGFVKSFDRRTGGVDDPLVGGVRKAVPAELNLKETEIQTADGKVVKANFNPKTGRYEVASFGGKAPGGSFDKVPIEAPQPGGAAKVEFDRLPKEKQIQVEDYAKAISAYKKSAGGLRSALDTGKGIVENKDKISHYLLTLKNLNSPTNPDAVGAEEVTRIAPELRRQFLNFTNPSAVFIGTDVPAFERKLETFITNLENNAKTANKEIDALYGRNVDGPTPTGDIPAPKSKAEYDKLPIGAKYQKDGVVRVKK